MSVATPHSTGRTSRISATSESPGSAPRTATGPVALLIRDEVDLGDEVVLAADLAREAVVRLEGDDVAGLDLEHRLEVRPERQITWSRGDSVLAPRQSQGGGL